MSDGMGRLGELEARLAKLAEATRAELPERARALRAAFAALPTDEAHARAELRRLAHMVRGSAGSHGMHEVTEPAARLEAAAAAMPASALAALVSALADRLDETARMRPSSAEPGTEPPSGTTNLPSSLVKRLVGRRVLAVDDDASTRRLLSMTLVNLGGADATIVDGERAFFAALEATPYEAVVLDAMMPELSGRECLERIAGSALARPDVRYFVLSAATAEELRWTLPSSLHVAWLRKPFRPRELIDAIAAAF